MKHTTETSVTGERLHAAPCKRREGPFQLSWTYPLFVSLGVFLLFILNLCQGARVVEDQHTVSKLKEIRTSLEKEQMGLKLQIEKLSSLDRIERVALTRLGMEQPPAREVLDLTPMDMKTAALRTELASGRLPFNARNP